MSQQPSYIADVPIYTGTDFTQTFVFEDSQSNMLKNLTGYTACSSMRRYESSSVAENFTVNFGNDRTTGKITISLNATQTGNLKAGKYFYDLLLKDPDGNIDRVVEGTVQVKKSITR